MQSIKQKALKRLSALKMARSSFEIHWQELSEYILPRSTRFFTSDANQNKRNTKIINSRATLAARTQTSGMMSGITSPSKAWFQLKVSDMGLNDNHEVRVWLDAVEERMTEVFNRSNFYQSITTVYQHIGTFATSAMLVEEDSDDVIRCETFPIGSYFLAQNGKQIVDAFYREFMMSVVQLVDTFGIDNVSDSVKSLYENKEYDKYFEIVHLIEVNRDRDTRYIDSKNKDFISVYFEKSGEDDKLLRVSGYDEFPIMAPRWEINGEDVYGSNCPGMVCLGDVKAIQIEERRKNKVTDLITDPPMVAPTGLRAQRASLVPGGITYYDEGPQGQRIQPAVVVDPNSIAIMRADIKEMEQRVSSAYFEDLFLMLANTQRANITATEIMERKEEKLLVLGPVLSRLDDDFLDPVISRTYNIMLRRNLLPKPPEILQGQDIKIEYISVLAQAQKTLGIQNIERFVSFVSGTAAAKPEILDNINFDEMLTAYADKIGIDAKLLIDSEQVQQLRKQRQQQQQQMQSMQMGAEASQIAKNVGDISQDSMLSQMMGGQ